MDGRPIKSDSVILEFSRVTDAADPHAFRFEPQTYNLRNPGGSVETAEFPWDHSLLEDLARLQQMGGNPAIVQRIMTWSDLAK